MTEFLPGMKGERRDAALSQWYTPPDLAERIVAWALQPYADSNELHVLEPSAGRGALVKPLLARGVSLVAVDIDPLNIPRLAEIGATALCADFTSLDPADAGMFDLAVMNPPFEGNQVMRHVMHALSLCERVVCHCPLSTLESKSRRAGLWTYVELHRLAVCGSRASYSADSEKTAMCTIDVSWSGMRAPQWSGVTVEVWP